MGTNGHSGDKGRGKAICKRRPARREHQRRHYDHKMEHAAALHPLKRAHLALPDLRWGTCSTGRLPLFTGRETRGAGFARASLDFSEKASTCNAEITRTSLEDAAQRNKANHALMTDPSHGSGECAPMSQSRSRAARK